MTGVQTCALPIIIVWSNSENIIPELEYLIIFGALLLICATLKMIQFLPKYNEWLKHENTKIKRRPNFIEIIIRFLIEHVEKLYLVLLYYVCFGKLNAYHTLILMFFIFFTLSQKYARKCFIIVIIILSLRAILRYIVLVLIMFGMTFDNSTKNILEIVGIEIDWSLSEKTVFKIDFDLELVVMYFASYIQRRIFIYIELNPIDNMAIDNKSIFIRLFKLLYTMIQTYLIWGIYLAFILVLSYQNINSFIQGYMIIVSMMIAIHASVDLSDNKFEGYLSVKPL